MLINKSNYEPFAIDYLEGNLNASELQAMRAFLQAHPDVDAELEMMKEDLFTFEADENIVYENKQSLLKEETPIIALRPRRWYKIATAAAIAILLIGFGAGYFAAQHLEESNAVATIEDTKKDVESTQTPAAPNEQKVAEIVIAEPSVHETAVVVSNQNLKASEVKQTIRKAVLQPIENLATETTALVMKEEIKEINTLPENTLEIDSPSIEVLDNQVVAFTELPQVDITITIKSMEVTSNKTAFPINSELQKPKNRIAALASDHQLTNKLSKVKSFLGKLPFEDATLEAFVPTYLAGE